ncbi:uncharacterized protein LOC128230345 [Mya arenaria]|uniref:uncharacterized protein LOC128230345 n=1 Tax=Mya arenaria TaxID=6604 RepID=UPI0022E6F342|nr:uncharacterized protein LOC128230345 [Mya arenaria]
MEHVGLIFVISLNFQCHVFGSLYDPHPFPSEGPFFEGWYTRILNLDSRESLGLLFGSVLPDAKRNATGPLVVASFLFRKCNADSGVCVLRSVDGKFDVKNLRITAKDQPVVDNPNVKSPSNFRWEVNNGDIGGYFQQTGNKTEINFKLSNISFHAEIGHPTLWNEDGTGPEGWLGYLPLPLHWFVFSLSSQQVTYTIQNFTSGAVIQGRRGLAHMEKNWGKSFPKSWIWTEGMDPSSNVTFAMSGGLVDFSMLTVQAFLIGYRNPSTGIKLDFRPDNSVVSAQMDGCSGSVNISVTSLLYSLKVQLLASPATFSSCLLGPETSGFRPACVESYDATVKVSVSKRTFVPFVYTSMDEQIIANAALEFGGQYVCKNKCYE